MNIDNVFKQFQKDVKNHSLTVLRDEGVYRHLRFSDGTSVYRFDIITWPGSLCISGDMGCQVFERVYDMFEFFDSKDLKINPYYWSEKSQAGVVKEFDNESFSESVEELIKELKEDLERPEFSELIEDLENAKDSYDIYEAVASIRSIENCPYYVYETLKFEDYTFVYIWRLFAIVWGIQKYKNEINNVYNNV